MLTLHGPRQHFCQGISRRGFLTIGGLALGGLGLADILRHEARAGIRSSNKAVIMVYLPGGPPHQDMVDLKPEAPAEIRGEFSPIATNVPGIEVCEHLPKLAAMMHKLIVVRSLVGCRVEHDPLICLSGVTAGGNSPQIAGGWPSLGSYLSKLQGPTRPGVPPYAAMIPQRMGSMFFAAPGHAGYLGPAHAPFRPEGEVRRDMTLQDITLNRLADRKRLLHSVDRMRYEVDASGAMDAADRFHQQAFDVLLSSKLVDALDVSREDPRIRERYGQGSHEFNPQRAPYWNDQLLVARRLVEAGVRCVAVSFGYFDNHVKNFPFLKTELPKFDQVLSALVEDLHQRGLDRDVSVVAWGEMGRTPRINAQGGRDHWGSTACAFLAGGGMRTGQVLGATDRIAGEVTERPIHVQNVFATLYRNLGIDVRQATVPDLTGRPRFLVERTEPIAELL